MSADQGSLGDLADAPPAPETVELPDTAPTPKRAARSRKRTTKPTAPKPDTPPRAPRPPGRPARNNLRARIEEMISGVGLTVFIINAPDGAAILAGAERLAIALDALAAENPSVQRSLERMLAVNAWGQVLAATSAIALPILANHNIIPAELVGLAGPAAPDPNNNGGTPQ